MTKGALAVRTPLLQQRAFRMLSITRFLSRLAQNALNFGLVLLIVDETGKAFLSSLLVLALVIPSTVAGMAAGTAADVFPKRLLVVVGDIARALVCILFIRGSGSVATYYIVAVALSAAGQFATSAEGAILPAIIAREDLTHANAISHAVGGAAQLLGLAVLTPIVLRLFGSPELLFGICSALFAVAAVYALFIGNTAGAARREIGRDPEGSWWLIGWRQMRSDAAVMHAAIELTLISTVLVILAGLIPKFIEETLGLPVDVGAVVLMPAAVGVVIGLRIASFLAHRVPHAALSTFGFAAFVVNLALLTFVNEEASFLSGYGMFAWLGRVNIGNFDGGGLLAMILVAPLGFAYAVVSVSAQTIVNDRVPLFLQGRVLATQGAMAAIASSAPVLAAGALSDVVGIRLVMALVAAVIGAAAVANVRPRGMVTATAGSAS
jgi:MFS transporter, DHA3 family, macrolide efflux protein